MSFSTRQPRASPFSPRPNPSEPRTFCFDSPVRHCRAVLLNVWRCPRREASAVQEVVCERRRRWFAPRRLERKRNQGGDRGGPSVTVSLSLDGSLSAILYQFLRSSKFQSASRFAGVQRVLPAVGFIGDHLYYGLGQSSSSARACFDPGGMRCGRHAGRECSTSRPCACLMLIASNGSVSISLVSQVGGKRGFWKLTVLGSQRRRLGEVSSQGVRPHDERRTTGAWFDPSSAKLSLLPVENTTEARAEWTCYLLPSLTTQGPHLSSFGFFLIQLSGFGGSGDIFSLLKSNKSSFHGIWKLADPWRFIGPTRLLILALNMPRFLLVSSFGWDPGGFNAIGKSRFSFSMPAKDNQRTKRYWFFLVVRVVTKGFDESGLGEDSVNSYSFQIWGTVDDALIRTNVFTLEACLWIELSGTTTVCRPGERLWSLCFLQYRSGFVVFENTIHGLAVGGVYLGAPVCFSICCGGMSARSAVFLCWLLMYDTWLMAVWFSFEFFMFGVRPCMARHDVVSVELFPVQGCFRNVLGVRVVFVFTFLATLKVAGRIGLLLMTMLGDMARLMRGLHGHVHVWHAFSLFSLFSSLFLYGFL